MRTWEVVVKLLKLCFLCDEIHRLSGRTLEIASGMEVAVPQQLIGNVLDLLVTRNAADGAFSGVFADYQTLLQQRRELQVRHRKRGLENQGDKHMPKVLCTCTGVDYGDL